MNLIEKAQEFVNGYKFPVELASHIENRKNNIFEMVDTSKGYISGTCVFPKTGKLCICFITPCTNLAGGEYKHRLEFSSIEELKESISRVIEETLNCPLLLTGEMH